LLKNKGGNQDKMNIGLDLDNVISNFNDVLLEEYLKHDKEVNNSGIVNQNVYITRGMFDWPIEEQKSFYKENIERIAKSLKVKDGVIEYINKLRKEGHAIYIITGRDNGEYSEPYNMTRKWLDDNLVKYDRLILTDAYKNDIHGKTEKCIENNIDIMVDDSINICRDLKDTIVKPIIMDTPYNRECTDIERVNNFKEFYEYINTYKREKFNVILDTDTYNECDDQFALSYMIKSQDVFNIEAITVAPYSHKKKNETVLSGREKSYNEILKICNFLKFDTTNKVFKGAEDYICNGYNSENEAVNKIIEIALKNDKTYILAIGAITNVALAIKKEPKIIDKIEVVWLGGHSLLQKDNQEFNFRQDVEAVKIVFNSKVKLTIIPCKNVASNLRTSVFELNHYLKDKSELCNYLIERFYNDGYHGVQESRVIWDISAIAYMINKSWFTSEYISSPNIKEDTSYELTTNNHKITMVNYIDVNKVYNDLFKKLGE